MKPFKKLPRVCLLIAALGLGACGGDHPDQLVAYDGKNLIVEGVTFPPDTSLDFAPGKARVEVGIKPGMEAAFEKVLSKYSLTVAKRSGSTLVFVEVPAGFEMQWASALAQQPSVAFTGAVDPTEGAP